MIPTKARVVQELRAGGGGERVEIKVRKEVEKKREENQNQK